MEESNFLRLCLAFDYADIDDKSQVAAFWALSGVLTLQYETFKEVGTSKCVNYDGGCDYTGRGALMLRGSGTYREAALSLLRNYGSNPESVLEPSEAFLSAAWLWKKKRDIDDFGSQIGVAELLLAANRFGINSATDLALLGTIYARSLLCLANDTTCAWYVVSQGDTPQLIAAALNVNIDTLVALNNWSGPNQALTPGESIKIYCTST